VLSDLGRQRRYEWSDQHQKPSAKERVEAARKQEDLRKALERAEAKLKDLAEREAEVARKQEDLCKALERALAKHKGLTEAKLKDDLAEREAKTRSVLNEEDLRPAGKRVDSGRPRRKPWLFKMAAYMFTAAAGLLFMLPLLGLPFPASPYVPLAAIMLGSMLYGGAWRARRVELAVLRFVVPFAAIRLLLHWARRSAGATP